MSIFDVLTMLGGLCLFLFGMTLMGQALERRAGGRLRSLLGKMTTGRLAGFFTGLGVTAVIQSSSATSVMVVGFVNSGMMKVNQPSASCWAPSWVPALPAGCCASATSPAAAGWLC